MAYRKTAATAARREARRTVLLDAATRMFASHGYHGATVPMIVAEAGSSVGSFYVHFRNKEDIFAAVLEALGRKLAEIMKIDEVAQPNPLLRIAAAVQALFVHLAQFQQEARILIVESSGLSPHLEQVRRSILRNQAEEVHRDLLSSPNVFSVMDSIIAARCLVGAVYESLYSWLEEDPAHRQPAEIVARAVADYNIRALRAQ
jgi:AcrR family transcriptional regulator